MKKTVLILGAGASKAYGYPLWSQLRQQIVDFDFDCFVEKIKLDSVEKQHYIKVHEEFLELHTKHPNYTLDKIVFEIDKPKEKHLNPTGYRLICMAGYLLANIEQKTTEPGWVSDFQELLIDHIVDESNQHGCHSNFLNNLTVVSLNYDRSFEHFVSAGFYEKLIKRNKYTPNGLPFSKNLSTKNWLRILKPHGYICELKNNHQPQFVGVPPDLSCRESHTQGIRFPGSNLMLSYGDKRLLDKKHVERMGLYMYMVDERGDSDYATANSHISNAELVICLGLSPEGISQSFFKFNEGLDVYANNTSTDLSNIRNKTAKFRSLGGESRLDAKDFTEKFRELAFNN